LSACVETVNHRRIKVEERKRKAIFLNPEQTEYRRGKIDGCLVTSGIRADYFVSGEGRTVIVELKGSDVDHACKQMFEAIEHAAVKPYVGKRCGFLIICSRFPSDTTTVQLAKNAARTKYKTKLLVYTNEREVSMSDFD